MNVSTSTAIVLTPRPQIRSYDQILEPTREQYAAFDKLFTYFNDKLFGGELPCVMLTFSRKAKSLGFFVPDNWASTDGGGSTTAEIALNPDHLDRDPRDVVSTLVHEQVHLWQHLLGTDKPSRAYHNREWSAKMESIGLMPSATGEPGGKRTGQKMDHYVIVGGRFDAEFARMPDEWFLPFVSSAPEKSEKPKAKSSKTKFECRTCRSAAWGKPDLLIGCRACDEPMVALG